MTIKEVEERTGLTRSNVRFYEKEKLIAPLRNEQNGYRDYSEKDVENLKKIAYLRTLGISIEDIRSIQSGEVALRDVIEQQNHVLEGQMADLSRAKAMCERMLDAEELRYEELCVEQYADKLQNYWEDNRQVFKLDSVSFLYLWGSFLVWAAMAALCLMTGILFYSKLPPEIPVQWNNETAVSLVDKKFIFAYPAACVVVRYLLRPFIYAKLQIDGHYGELIAEYLTNYLCFVALSLEIFSILFLYGLVKNVVVLLAVDTIVLLGLLCA